METDYDGIPEDKLELAATIFELIQLGLIREKIDASGVPRFELTGRTLYAQVA